MNATARILPKLSVRALCIATALLPACSTSGGVDSDGAVVPMPQPQPQTPDPPPPPPDRALTLPAAPTPATAPVAPAINGADTPMIRLVGLDQRESMGPVSSAGSLTKQGDGQLFLNGDNRFDAGVAIEDGLITLWYGNLFADVTISEGATLEVIGDVVGDVINNGVFDPIDWPGYYQTFYDAEIFGDYTQGPSGVLRLAFGVEGNGAPTPQLEVTGTARLDGMVEFGYGGYVPAAGYLEWILHAHGGVIGEFDGWRTQDRYGPLFLTGSLNYGPNDVWFLATRASTAATLAASGVGDALTLASAGNVDAAFAAADAVAGRPQASWSDAQRAFLHSAATIQRMSELDQATAAFDSLSGHGHLAATDALVRQAFGAASLLSAHAGAIRPGDRVGAWRSRHSLQPGIGGDFPGGPSGGVDRWVSERLLFGSRVGRVHDARAVDRDGGVVRADAPTAQAYLRRFGDDGSYTMGSVGFGQHQLHLTRGLDFGHGLRPAHSQQDVSLAQAAFEAGRQFEVGGGELAAYAVVDYAALRGAGFVELGNTGFELIAQPSLQQHAAAGFGLRYGRRWQWGGRGWLQLGLDLRYEPSLWSTGTVRAAFTGMPEARFDLLGLSETPDPRSAALQLSGAGGGRWAWQVQAGSYAGEPAAGLSFEFALR
jgi:autotransporter-associated beta strand protein